MLHTVLCTSSVTNVDVVTLVGQVDVCTWRRTISNPVNAIHCHAMLEEYGTLVSVKLFVVPDVEHSQDVTILCRDLMGPPLVGGIPLFHLLLKSRILHTVNFICLFVCLFMIMFLLI